MVSVNKILNICVFVMVSVLLFFVLFLYCQFINVVAGFFNILVLLLLICYAIFLERYFRKIMKTKHIVYPVIVFIIYFFLIEEFFLFYEDFSIRNGIGFVVLFGLSGVLLSLPIAFLFDIIGDLKDKKKKKQRKRTNLDC